MRKTQGAYCVWKKKKHNNHQTGRNRRVFTKYFLIFISCCYTRGEAAPFTPRTLALSRQRRPPEPSGRGLGARPAPLCVLPQRAARRAA